jgi:hypothetical protein
MDVATAQFVSDANTSDLFRRKHNRLEIVLILVKTLAIFVSQYPVAMLVLYLLLLLSHAATMVSQGCTVGMGHGFGPV